MQNSDGTTVERLRKVPRVEAPCKEEELSIEDARGIWADESPASVELQRYFEDPSARRLWHAAMTGDVAKVLALLFIEIVNMYASPQTE
jgi:hypothetical protein